MKNLEFIWEEKTNTGNKVESMYCFKRCDVRQK
jgi:hypothetical protein